MGVPVRVSQIPTVLPSIQLSTDRPSGLRTGSVTPAAGSDQAAQLAATPDVGSSAGGWALAAALAWSLPPGRWRQLTLTAILGGLTVVAVAYHRLFDLQHLTSATLVIAALAVRNGSSISDLSAGLIRRGTARGRRA